MIEVRRIWPTKSNAQEFWLNSIEHAQFLLGGGSVGSLKSMTMLMDAAQEMDSPYLHGIIFRNTHKEIERDILPKTHQLYSQMGAKYNGSEKAWKWPWGATIRLGYLENLEDVMGHYGTEYTFIGVDESTRVKMDHIRHIMTRLRSVHPELKRRVRLATNPGGVSGEETKQIFIGPHCNHCYISEASKTPFRIYDNATWGDGKAINMTTCFVPGKISDHSLLDQDYLKTLDSLPDRLRTALLEGCWDSFEGQFFACWNPQVNLVNWETKDGIIGMKHTLEPYFSYWVSLDYGFGASRTAAYLHVKTPEGMIYTIDEVVVQHMDAPDAANYLKMRWHGLVDEKGFEREILAWYLSPDAWQSRGMRSDSGRSIAEQMQAESDISFEQASNDRAGGAMLMYGMLKTGKWKICADMCPNLVRSLPSRIHNPDKPEDVLKIDGDPLDDSYDGCFIGETKITTNLGERSIKDIKSGDLVLTRKGYRKVLQAWKSGVNRPVVTAKLTNGAEITGTPNHPIFVENRGFIPLGELTPRDILFTCENEQKVQKSKLLNSTTSSSEDTPTLPTEVLGFTSTPEVQIGKKVYKPFTKRFGKVLTEIFQRVMTFITSMETHLTMTPLTWKPSWNFCTVPNTEKNAREKTGLLPTWRKFAPLHRNGMDQKPDTTGIVNTGSKLWPSENWPLTPVDTATRNLKQNVYLKKNYFAQMRASLLGGALKGLTIFKKLVSSVQKISSLVNTPKVAAVQNHVAASSVGLNGTADVYNLEVEGENEYFANGILVHNCRYGLMSWIKQPKTPKNVLIAQAITSNDPTVAHMQWLLAREKFNPKVSPMSYRGGRIGRA